jgi:hypothetical protein
MVLWLMNVPSQPMSVEYAVEMEFPRVPVIVQPTRNRTKTATVIA